MDKLLWLFGIYICVTQFTSQTIAAQELQSGSNCMDCHSNAFVQWRDSGHAYSTKWTNPLYREMLRWAERSAGEAATNACRNCHSPAIRFQQTINVPMAVIQEGVGCDFCHSVQLRNDGHHAKFEVLKDGAKLGPIKDAIPSAHECRFSEDHTRSEFCLVCHSNEKTESGVTFCSSENEWQEFVKRNTRIECQDCHMPTREGRAAQLGKMRDKVHSHDFWGGYSEKMLHSAVQLELSAEMEENAVKVQVISTNRGAGHFVPTGSPMRYVVLKIVAKNSKGNIIWQNWRSNPIKEDPGSVFMKLLEGKDGAAPVPPWEASHERFDQRLRPQVPRKLVYTIPESDVLSVEAKLIYRVAPPALLDKLGITEQRYTVPRIIASEVAVPQRIGSMGKE